MNTSSTREAKNANSSNPIRTILTEGTVHERYAKAARQTETALCCSVQFDAKLLAVIPDEIIERDYGCGDPTPFVRTRDVVLDLGSGGGKVCYIAAQLVGPLGRVIGVDCNLDMLELARRHRTSVAGRLGYSNVEFHCGMIQDLRLDLDLLCEELAGNPVRDQKGWLELRSIEERLRRERPMVPDESVDCVISNCVLNLVRTQDRLQLFTEIHRVLKPGGRAAISDIVANRDVPESLQQDPELWSGCVSGAYREDRFVQAFENAGFSRVQTVFRQQDPWRTVAGIEFRSVTVSAHKGPMIGTPLPALESCCTPNDPCC